MTLSAVFPRHPIPLLRSFRIRGRFRSLQGSSRWIRRLSNHLFIPFSAQCHCCSNCTLAQSVQKKQQPLDRVQLLPG